MDVKLQIKDVLAHYPSLSYDSDSNTINGKIYVAQNDYYDVRIDLKEYPKIFPWVAEIGERIPSHADRHKYTDSDICCLTTPAMAQVLLKTKIKTLLLFVREIVIPYFKNNSYYELNRKYLYSAYAHGIPGIIQAYKDILGLTPKSDYRLILKLIDARIAGANIKENELCYCGSKLPMRKCYGGKHLQNYRSFKKIDNEVLIQDRHLVVSWANTLQKSLQSTSLKS